MKKEQTIFWERFYNLCLEREKAPNAVCKDLGFSSATSTHWKNGSIPSDVAKKVIAEYFDVSVDYLLGNTDKREKLSATKDEELSEYLEKLRVDENYRMMFSLMDGASKEDVAKAVQVVKALLGEN